MPRAWNRWTTEELELLVDHYATTSKGELIVMFAPHPWKSITTVAGANGLVRPRVGMGDAERLRRKRIDMARRRRDPLLAARVKEIARTSYARRGRFTSRDRAVRRRHRNFFHWRAELARGHHKMPEVTAQTLARLWRKQHGKCALTGRKLDRSAQLDHITPLARGGPSTLSNLQWVTKEVNLAKRDLLEPEFFALCQDVVEWIMRRIVACGTSEQAHEDVG